MRLVCQLVEQQLLTRGRTQIMRNRFLTRIGLLFAVAMVASLGSAHAADNCVVVVGTDSGGPNITMDPAFNNTDDDAYHQFAVYNRLMTFDRNMQLQPELAES